MMGIISFLAIWFTGILGLFGGSIWSIAGCGVILTAISTIESASLYRRGMSVAREETILTFGLSFLNGLAAGAAVYALGAVIGFTAGFINA